MKLDASYFYFYIEGKRVHQPTALLGGLLAAAGSVVGYVFHGLFRSETECRQHLPAALPIHVSAKRRADVHPENNGEALPKFYLRPEQTMENVPNYASADCPVNATSVTVHNMPTTNAYLSA